MHARRGLIISGLENSTKNWLHTHARTHILDNATEMSKLVLNSCCHYLQNPHWQYFFECFTFPFTKLHTTHWHTTPVCPTHKPDPLTRGIELHQHIFGGIQGDAIKVGGVKVHHVAGRFPLLATSIGLGVNETDHVVC